MAVIAKERLSGANDGLGIKIGATTAGSAGTTIHQAQSGTTAGLFDEIYIYATNTNTSAETVTIQFGGHTNPDNHIVSVVQPNETILVVPGLILQNGKTVTAISTTTNKVILHGFVNRISAS